MLLWTRVTPPAHLTTSELLLKWQISTASAFDTPLLKSGIATTSSARDFTVCVDVKDLKPCTEYYYRFFWEGEVSVTGITKTAASGRLEEMKFALVSCANFGFGYFNVYDLATRIDGLELIVHAGDYVYEYEKGNFLRKKCPFFLACCATAPAWSLTLFLPVSEPSIHFIHTRYIKSKFYIT